ncbi:MAG: dihydrolipoyl dehydrogenase [Bdellovibrionales bacterium]|nr:dihydrolipoyl dehydrogenase [Bdellovibrionales bacterium]
MEKRSVDTVILGGGPAGYSAAFFAADVGEQVLVVDDHGSPGGVCLRSGCIPSKALLHATDVVREVKLSRARGIDYSEPEIHLRLLREWCEGIIASLETGLTQQLKAREVEVLEGRGYFEDQTTLRVETNGQQEYITFKHALIATGSDPLIPQPLDIGHPNVITSDKALKLDRIPEKLLVVGGGYIGLELGTVFASLGSKVTLVEEKDALLPGVGRELSEPLLHEFEDLASQVFLSTRVKELSTSGSSLKAKFEGEHQQAEEFDYVLVATGRKPRTENLGLEDIGVSRDEIGFIKTGKRFQTDVNNIFAIGDVVGGELLAHSAFREGEVAIGVSLLNSHDDLTDTVIPKVVYTDPEVAWCGYQPEATDDTVYSATVPWKASGRALTMDKPYGVTKITAEKESGRIVGAGITGPHAGELISELVVAIELRATVMDLARIIHPHPTLSETVYECARQLALQR